MSEKILYALRSNHIVILFVLLMFNFRYFVEINFAFASNAALSVSWSRSDLGDWGDCTHIKLCTVFKKVKKLKSIYNLGARLFFTSAGTQTRHKPHFTCSVFGTRARAMDSAPSVHNYGPFQNYHFQYGIHKCRSPPAIKTALNWPIEPDCPSPPIFLSEFH